MRFSHHFFSFQRYSTQYTRILLSFFILVLTTTLPVASQPLSLEPTSLFQKPIIQVENLQTGDVYLDGRPVFTITAPNLVSEKSASSSRAPIRERISTIQHQLKNIAQSTLKESSAKVDITFDTETRVVEVNQQYLMTVTSHDAQILGSDMGTYIISLKRSLTSALQAYYRERQAPYVQKQVQIALLLFLVIVILALSERFLQKYIQRKRSHALSLIKIDELTRPNLNENLSEAEQSQVTKADYEFKRRLDQSNRIKFTYDIQSALLKIISISTYIGILFYILSRFPQTRWVQSLVLPTILTIALKLGGCILGIYLLIRLSLLGIDYGFSLLRAGQQLTQKQTVRSLLRLQTLKSYVKSVVIFLLTAIGVFASLGIFGIDLAPVLAGAGILGIAVSFGAQTFIKDIINGLFLLWEDQFGVGDVVTINQVSGLVETMSLRMTQLRSQDGDLISIPNGTIDMVSNHSNKWSRANLGIKVAYGTNIDEAIALIQTTAMQLFIDPDWRENILEEPQVLGVDAFGDNSITIRVWIKTQPLKQWDVSREFRRRLKIAFDRAGISIPFPQRSLWFENTLSVPNASIVAGQHDR